jgi:diadenosine tetraphosphatase ApaH/serine/threonine PP2A family protein phosphatase
VLRPDARAFLSGLGSSAVSDGIGLFHGSPRDPVWEYVLSWEAAHDAIVDSGTEITIVGHSHVPLAIPAGGSAEGGLAPAGTEIDLTSAAQWLLNPGSVGQPRDGDPDAAWLLLDLGERRASFRRVPYDIAQAQAAIRAEGLPEALAERLAHGV